jgi:hypothetical protein
MFVVMNAGATEAEILGVKSQILAEGLTPFDHLGEGPLVIALVGEIGARKPALLERFASLPGVASVRRSAGPSSSRRASSTPRTPSSASSTPRSATAR